MHRYLLILCLLSGPAFAQGKRLSEAFEMERARAYALVHEGKYREAEGILESLLLKAPDDTGVLFNYGYALYLEAETIADAKNQNVLRQKARGYFLKAKQAGLREPLVEQMLSTVQEDGSKAAARFSVNPEAELEMRQGEMAFSKRDFPAAQQHYGQALKHDPKLYAAAVFLGDIQFVQKQYAEANEWFAKAVVIDPDQEVAYRYWGDALSQSRHFDEAGEKYIQAVVAAPYQGLPWRTLVDWARRKGLQPNHPASKIPRANVFIKDGGVKLEVDPAGGTLGMAYGIVRAAEAGKALEAKRAYHHALVDEKLGLQALLEIGTILLADSKQAEEQKISAAMLNEVRQLKQLSDDGYLEAYIFFVRADAELAQDYTAYRATNREKLSSYLRDRKSVV